MTQLITRPCLHLLSGRRKLKSPGVATLQGFLELYRQSRVRPTWLVFSPTLSFHSSPCFASAGLRSVGIAVRLAGRKQGAKGMAAYRQGWLNQTTRSPRMVWLCNVRPGSAVDERQGSSPRSSGLGRLCPCEPSPPLTGNLEYRECTYTSYKLEEQMVW
jgi:hypothetical protein